MSQLLHVYLDKSKPFYNELRYISGLFLSNSGIDFVFTESVSEEVLIIDDRADADIFVDAVFFKEIIIDNAKPAPSVILEKLKQNDLIICFYLINSMDEFDSPFSDEIGRFRYDKSFKCKDALITQNLVQQVFNRLCLSVAKIPEFAVKKKKTRIFLSHDIDNVHGSLTEDGFYALRHAKPASLFKIALHTVLQRPPWLNMNEIMDIHTEYEMKSVFFWLVQKGRYKNGLVNADYKADSSRIKEIQEEVKKRGFENALHKSISDDSLFESEMRKVSYAVSANRNHYLRFRLPEHYRLISEAGIKADCSLGFAEQYGFRNSYGQPFKPYNFEKKSSYGFVEVPLHVMDRTFFSYRKDPAKNVAKLIIQFIEQNSSDCVLSVLWHNNFFTSLKYGGYLKIYKEVLQYCYDSGIKSMSLKEIMDEYGSQNY